MFLADKMFFSKILFQKVIFLPIGQCKVESVSDEGLNLSACVILSATA